MSVESDQARQMLSSIWQAQGEKIEELKKLGDKKMHIEYHKIQTKLTSDSIKIIKRF